MTAPKRPAVTEMRWRLHFMRRPKTVTATQPAEATDKAITDLQAEVEAGGESDLATDNDR